MKKRSILLICIISFIGVFGVKAYNNIKMPQLLVSNLRALSASTENGRFRIVCPQPGFCGCAVQCSICGDMFQSSNPNGCGAYIVGECPSCHYDYGDGND